MDILKGYVDHIIFRNDQNGYTVFVLISDDDEFTCVGMVRTIEEGESIEAEGEFVEHPAYGYQFKISTLKIIPPEDTVSMERYLGSGAIKGIGPALAKRIVKYFKKDTFRIIEEEPERLTEIKGISERIAREIAEQMEEKKGMREALIFLQRYGISNTLAVKIYNQYGTRIYNVLQDNPYQLADDITGVGFKIADEIAKLVGIHTDSDFRIRSGILYILLLANSDGNMYLPMNMLMRQTADLLGLEEEHIAPHITNLTMDKKVICKQLQDEVIVYATNNYYAELNCAKMLHDLNVSLDLSDEEGQKEEQAIYQKVMNLESDSGIELESLQRKAVVESAKSGLFVLTGGPGTGKTTTINMMIRYFVGEGYDIFLAAPTGRAAKRMTETTGYEARTIHRLLELNGAMSEEGKKTSFERNEENPLEADVIIVDEMSMVDIYLFQSLLRAICVGTRLIMVGDMNQLPSVGPGQVLKDLIASKQIPVVCLEKIFRQAVESDIVMNAHRINRGETLPLNNKSRDFFFLERSDTQVIYKHMIQLICDKMPRYVHATPYDIQVLTPMRKGPLGVEVLNQILQKYLNPPDQKKKEHLLGERVFREGDKVMQIKNNYQLEWEILSKYGIPVDKGTGVFNGDIGIIKQINEYSQTVTVEFDDLKTINYPFTGLDELELAYAITIHKSQGSEYPAVIMPILNGPRMLFNRNLLYTGVTRARTCVTILGSKEMLASMVENQNLKPRYSSLKNRIVELGRSCEFEEDESI